jgi:hypothetical protein
VLAEVAMRALRAKPIEPVKLAAELAARWLPSLSAVGWSERLRLLNHMHEQLQDDLNDLHTYSVVSPLFVREVIQLLGGGRITTEDQAQIYANSADTEHRRAAGDWLARHRSAARMRPKSIW